jgi:hypothetical protein
MSEENVETVLDGYARFNAGDKEAGLWFFTPDSEYQVAREKCCFAWKAALSKTSLASRARRRAWRVRSLQRLNGWICAPSAQRRGCYNDVCQGNVVGRSTLPGNRGLAARRTKEEKWTS